MIALAGGGSADRALVALMLCRPGVQRRVPNRCPLLTKGRESEMTKNCVSIGLFFVVVFCVAGAAGAQTAATSQALCGQGYQLSLQGKHKESLECFEKVLRADPNNIFAHCYKGVVLFQLERWNESLAANDAALQLDKDCIFALNSKAAILNILGKNTEAKALRERAISLQPKQNDALSYFGRGLANAELERFNPAIADYTAALKINPGLADAYYNRAQAYRGFQSVPKEKWCEMAIADCNTALQICPQFEPAYVMRAECYARLDKLDLAIADYASAITIDPRDAWAYYRRGTLHRAQGRNDLAIADYTSALAINPKYADVYFDRGKTYYQQKDYQSAQRDWEKAAEVDPSGIQGLRAKTRLQDLQRVLTKTGGTSGTPKR